METSHIVLLVVSASVSFGLGRAVLYFRKKSRDKETKERELIALRNRPAEVASKNKAKRRRQLQQQGKHSDKT